MLLFGPEGVRAYWGGTAVFIAILGACIGLGVGVGVALVGIPALHPDIHSRLLRMVVYYTAALAGSAPAWLLTCWNLLDLGWWWVFVIAVPAAVWLYRRALTK
jgi:hypothetical protein